MTSDGGPSLLQVNLAVADLAETVRFLRLLGYEVSVPEDFPHLELRPGGGPVSVEFDERSSIELWNAGAPDRTGGSAVVVLALPDRDSVDAAWQRVIDGGFGSSQPPFDAFWGARFAVVVDADGNQFGLMSPRDPAT